MNRHGKHSYVALGLMSGTSLDGIDAALLETDGDQVLELGPYLTYSYPTYFRQELAEEVRRAGISGRPTDNRDLVRSLTEFHIEAVFELLGQVPKSSKWEKPDILGFHGHTTLHRPQSGITQQIGDAQLLANRSQLKVISNFRKNDVEMGGEGAPLVPIYHAAMCKNEVHPTAVINIGGISNLTWIDENISDLIAFDTGPGNCLLDMWVEERIGAFFDKDGELACAGMPDSNILEDALNDPFFMRVGPKSLDRMDFDLASFARLSTENGAATLVEFTVRSILLGIGQCPALPNAVYVSGGGRHNKAIMKRLSEECMYPIHPVESLGWDGDAVEAQAFAYLAVRSLRQLPITFPGTTGANSSLLGGDLSIPI
ncbi:MAG: anhydro-N-acetylmuramic acid kinase [Rhodospirillaceae bacterium]